MNYLYVILSLSHTHILHISININITHLQSVQLILQHHFDFEESLLLFLQLLQTAVHFYGSRWTQTIPLALMGRKRPLTLRNSGNCY